MSNKLNFQKLRLKNKSLRDELKKANHENRELDYKLKNALYFKETYKKAVFDFDAKEIKIKKIDKAIFFLIGMLAGLLLSLISAGVSS